MPAPVLDVHCLRDPGCRCQGRDPGSGLLVQRGGGSGYPRRGVGALALGPQALLGPSGICLCVLAQSPSDQG